MNNLHLSALTATFLLAPSALAGETVTRLVVGDAQTNTLTVLDPASR